MVLRVFVTGAGGRTGGLLVPGLSSLKAHTLHCTHQPMIPWASPMRPDLPKSGQHCCRDQRRLYCKASRRARDCTLRVIHK